MKQLIIDIPLNIQSVAFNHFKTTIAIPRTFPVAFEHEFTNKRGIRSVCIEFTIAENTPMNEIFNAVQLEYKRATHEIRLLIAKHHVANRIERLNLIESEQ